MKKTAFFVFFIFVQTLIFAQENKKLVIQHLTDNFYVYTTYKGLNGLGANLFMYPSNSMYLVTEAGVVLFDTPWDPDQFQPLLDSIAVRHNKKVVMAIVTHYHDDRTAGLEFLRQKGVKTYSSKLTNDLSKTFNQKQAALIFENDTTFNIGGYKFETLYAGEGHTKDNLVIWFEGDAVLYGGCLVKSVESKTLGNTDDANTEAWSTTVKKISKKYRRAQFVIPGHFGGTGREALRHTLKLLKASD